MSAKKVKDLMLPLDEYAIVNEEATLLEAVLALDEAQEKLPANMQPHRAVLVVNFEGKVVGKLGHLAFLRALEPKYSLLGDLPTLSRAGLSSEFVTSMIENMRLWQEDLTDVCKQACHTKVKKVMRPVAENIDENASLSEAIHKMIMWQTLSILVKRRDEVVGILRLSDLYAELAKTMKETA